MYISPPSRKLAYRLLFYFFIIILRGARASPLGTAATIGLLYQSQTMADGDCGAIGGMKIGRGNRSTWRKPAPVPLRYGFHGGHNTAFRSVR
jgi:hypothetical protein